MQKRACCRFPILFLEAARGKLRFQKQDTKTRLILFSYIVSGGCCGNPLVIGAISWFWHQETIWENAPGFVCLYCFWGCTFVDILVMFGAGYQSVVAFLSEVETPEDRLVNRFGGRLKQRFPYLYPAKKRNQRNPRKRSHRRQDKPRQPRTLSG